jgi:plastocyanin
VLQMVVQVVFFLHIGRERGPRFNLWFLLATVGAIVVVVGASLWIMGHLHANMEGSDVIQKAAGGEAIAQVGGKDTGACGEIFAHYEVTIKNGVVSPLHTDAHRCDTITFINEDDQVKDIAFGEHPNHVAYAGQLDIITYKGHPETLTLSQAGTYKFHDHLHEATAGDFTVRP